MFIHTPTITSNDCEGAGEVFTVQVSLVYRNRHCELQIFEFKLTLIIFISLEYFPCWVILHPFYTPPLKKCGVLWYTLHSKIYVECPSVHLSITIHFRSLSLGFLTDFL